MPIIPEFQWSDAMPKTTGLWEIRCMESGQEPSRVAITNRGPDLYVHCSDVGVNPVKHYHDGLCDVTWRKLA